MELGCTSSVRPNSCRGWSIRGVGSLEAVGVSSADIDPNNAIKVIHNPGCIDLSDQACKKKHTHTHVGDTDTAKKPQEKKNTDWLIMHVAGWADRRQTGPLPSHTHTHLHMHNYHSVGLLQHLPTLGPPTFSWEGIVCVCVCRG